MSMIVYRREYDKFGRVIEHSFDTDCMAQSDYSKYTSLKSELENLHYKVRTIGKAKLNLIYGINCNEVEKRLKKEMRDILKQYIVF